MPKFTIGPYTVHFTFDRGDWSVGIPGGWEESLVTFMGKGDIEMVVGFVPDSNKPVDQWTIDYLGANRPNPNGPALEVNSLLMDAASGLTFSKVEGSRELLDYSGIHMRAAVAAAWEYLNWEDYLSILRENVWGLESHIADIEWETTGEGERPLSPEAAAHIANLRAELAADKFWLHWATMCYGNWLAEHDEMVVD